MALSAQSAVAVSLTNRVVFAAQQPAHEAIAGLVVLPRDPWI